MTDSEAAPHDLAVERYPFSLGCGDPDCCPPQFEGTCSCGAWTYVACSHDTIEEEHEDHVKEATK